MGGTRRSSARRGELVRFVESLECRRLLSGAGGGVPVALAMGAIPETQNPYPTRVAPDANSTLIQAEDFDLGGEGVSFHDGDVTNRGGAYRVGGVDIGSTSDTNGGYAVGWTQAGEWIEYTIDVRSGGTYNILTRVANAKPSASFHIELDGANVTGALAVPDTDSWHRSRTVASPAIDLPAGPHVLRLAFDRAAANGSVGNFNWLRLVEGIDTRFGEAGVVVGVPGYLLPQPDGRTIVVGAGRITRLTSRGRVDFSVSVADAWDETTTALIQPDGKILAATTSRTATGETYALRRFHPDGKSDKSFGKRGVARSSRPIQRLALQPDGRILAGGATDFGRTRFFLRQYTSNGTNDELFPAAYADAEAEFIGTSADGRIYLVSRGQGECVIDENYGELECPTLMFIRRLRTSGRTDTSYGDAGVTTVIRPESQLWARDPSFWGQQVLPNGSVVSGEIHIAYIGTDESSVITVPPDGAQQISVHPEQYSALTGTALLARFDGETVLAGRFDPYSADVGPYFTNEHNSLIGGGRHTPWGYLYETDAIGQMAFTQDGGLLVSSAAGITKFLGVPPRQTPRRPGPWSVGQRIEAEDFDDGGAGVSYRDADAINRGGAYRVSHVDLGPTNDTGGGFAVGWTQPGEWLEYTVTVPEDGLYDVDVRVASKSSGGRFHIEIGGKTVTESLRVPDTSSYHKSQTVTRAGIRLTRGTHVLRVSFDQAALDGAVGDFNWLRLRASGAGSP